MLQRSIRLSQVKIDTLLRIFACWTNLKIESSLVCANASVHNPQSGYEEEGEGHYECNLGVQLVEYGASQINNLGEE